MQLSSVPAPTHAPGNLGTIPKLDAPAFRVTWDFEHGGDDEGRSDELTFTPTGSTIPVGYSRSVADLAKAASSIAKPDEVWGAFQTEDGADFLSRLHQTNRLNNAFGTHVDGHATVADIARTISFDSWMAARDDSRLVAVADAATALDASTWATL